MVWLLIKLPGSGQTNSSAASDAAQQINGREIATARFYPGSQHRLNTSDRSWGGTQI